MSVRGFPNLPELSLSDTSLDFLTQIPTYFLHQELLKRNGVQSPSSPSPSQRPACGGGPDSSPGYNTSLHVIGLVIILLLSTLSCAIPLIVRKVPSLPIPHKFLFLSRHFGTGVLLATAFVHLLPTAFGSLTDPCLPRFWTDTFPQMPGFIALLAVFLVVSIEMYFAMRGARHHHGSGFDNFNDAGSHKEAGDVNSETHALHDGSDDDEDREQTGYVDNSSTFDGPLQDDLDDREQLLNHQSQKAHSDRVGGLFPRESTDSDSFPLTSNTQSRQVDRPSSGDETPSGVPLRSLSGRDNQDHPRTPTSIQPLDDPQAMERDLLQVVLLEAGILFHSIFIGLSLSTTRGTTFVVLLIAISIHQTFEGLALGSRISAIRFPTFTHDYSDDSLPLSSPPSSSLVARLQRFGRRWQPWLMCLAFGITTPIGQAIGLAVHNLFDPAGQLGLILVGCTNAVSSGFLLFAGLVSLLTEDFLTDKSYVDLQGSRRKLACGCVVAGALAMSAVGIWA